VVTEKRRAICQLSIRKYIATFGMNPQFMVLDDLSDIPTTDPLSSDSYTPESRANTFGKLGFFTNRT
jgi:hypothetical protein